jgi:hypothetical protein
MLAHHQPRVPAGAAPRPAAIREESHERSRAVPGQDGRGPAHSRHQRPPRPRSPAPAPRPQAITPPAPHAAPPLEPQAQRTSASGRAHRARPAVSGMLGAPTASVKRHMTRPDQGNDASRRSHDGGRRAPNRSGHDAARLGWGGAGARPGGSRPLVREKLPDHRGIVQRGDQPQSAPAMRARQHIKRERPVHQRRPAPGARTGLRLRALRCALRAYYYSQELNETFLSVYT